MTAVESEERTLFVATTRAFLDKEASLARVRELREANLAFERQWWQRAAQLGWAGLLVPEDLDGGSVSGNGVEDVAMVAQEIGKTVAPGPLHPVSTVLAGLVDADNRDAHADTIRSLVSGQKVASWAVYAPGMPWNPTEPAVIATATDSGYRLAGAADRVEAGQDSDLLLVVCRGRDGLRQVLVPADAAGVSIEPDQSIDMVKNYARVHFEDVEVDASATVGGVGQAHELIQRQSHIAQLLQCAEVVGILDTVLGFTVEWALNRYTFGRPLASYQALKHRFAEMKIWVEACRATTAHVVSEVARRSPRADLAVSIAKSYVGERAADIVQSCVQMHGGIGVTWEHDLHLYLRRVLIHRLLLGTPDEHNLRICARMEQMRKNND